MADQAALYVRVSTEDQDLAGQERELLAEAERRGWEVATIYVEKVSATFRGIPGFPDRADDGIRNLPRPPPVTQSGAPNRGGNPPSRDPGGSDSQHLA